MHSLEYALKNSSAVGCRSASSHSWGWLILIPYTASKIPRGISLHNLESIKEVYLRQYSKYDFNFITNMHANSKCSY